MKEEQNNTKLPYLATQEYDPTATLVQIDPDTESKVELTTNKDDPTAALVQIDPDTQSKVEYNCFNILSGRGKVQSDQRITELNLYTMY